MLYADLDPAPADLADGVLARLAVEDLETEYELLTLVERVDHAAPAPAGADVAARDDDATVALEFAGTTYRVLVRISTVDGGTAGSTAGSSRPCRCGSSSGPQGDALAHTRQSAYADARRPLRVPVPDDGRGAAVAAAAGRDESGTRVAPFVTPPFLL